MTPRLAIVAAGAALVLGLSGCAPEPAPTPTASGFTSEEEAFAAAEATYREYVKAVNARRADPAAPDPLEFLIGAALAAEIDVQNQLGQSGLRVVGESTVPHVTGVSLSKDGSNVVTQACLDSTQTRVLDADGLDVTPTQRSDLVLLRLTMVAGSESLLIEDSQALKSGSC